MARYRDDQWLGSGAITGCMPAIAGQCGTWSITYTVGVAGIDDGGRIRLAYRFASDWATPQFTDPSGPNYVSIRASRCAKLTPSFGPDGIRPWTKTITIRVTETALAPGDQVVIVLGDTIFGGPGIRVQTFTEENFGFRLQADPFGTGLYQDVTFLKVPIVAGPAQRLVLVSPSDVVVDEPSWLHVRAVDRWGNLDHSYRGSVRFSGDTPATLPEICQFTEEDGGVRRFEGVRYTQPGILTVTAQDEPNGFIAHSNPIRSQEQEPTWRLYWGDLHGQTEETVGTGTIPDYFAYGRNVSAIDVTAHQGNDFQITAEVYQLLRETVERFHEPSRFVTFHGYEWSGNTPAGGDHNVFYRDGGPLRRSSHTQVTDKRDLETDCYPVDRLYAANAGGEDVLITPHVGGRYASLAFHDRHLEPAIEIASQWGRFEWLAHEALQRGIQVGFMGGSDDHSGRPGWSPPTLAHHGVQGGLTAFLAPELTRDAIWDALRSRRCYGTSGPRIILDVTVDGHPIGTAYETDQPPTLGVRVIGTAPIDTVEVRRGLETVYTYAAQPEPEPDEPWRIRVAWRGARNRGRTRALDWNGTLGVWGGRIRSAENYAMDNPLDGIVGWDAGRIAWRSHTCGDWDGVILDLDGDYETVLDFVSPTMQFQSTLGDLVHGPICRVGPGLEQQVIVRRLSHREAPHDNAFTWRDESPVPGINPYWIWVTQADGELAWSSPVYVTWTKPES